jgi:hypothetical protein
MVAAFSTWCFDGGNVAFDLLDAEAEVVQFRAEGVLLRFDGTEGLAGGLLILRVAAAKAHADKD